MLGNIAHDSVAGAVFLYSYIFIIFYHSLLFLDLMHRLSTNGTPRLSIDRGQYPEDMYTRTECQPLRNKQFEIGQY